MTMIATGVDILDSAFGGGLRRGSVTLLAGPPGVGKTTLLVQACAGAATRHKSEDVHLTVYGQRNDDIYALAKRVGVESCRAWRTGDLSGSNLLALLLNQSHPAHVAADTGRKIALACFDGIGSPHPAELKAFALASNAAVVVSGFYPYSTIYEVDAVAHIGHYATVRGADLRVVDVVKNRNGTPRCLVGFFGAEGFKASILMYEGRQ